MVTQFNKKDLVSFGNFLLKQGKSEVSHADIENWKEKQSNVSKVRAKFEVTHIDSGEESSVINLTACIEGSPENKEFCKYTPSGNISMGIDNNAEALDYFSQNQEYYIDFIKVEK